MEFTIWHLMFFAGLGTVCFAIYCDKLAQAYRHATEAMVKSRNNTTIIIHGRPSAEDMKVMLEHLPLPETTIVDTPVKVIDLQGTSETEQTNGKEESKGIDPVSEPKMDSSEVDQKKVEMPEAERMEEHEVEVIRRNEESEELVEVDLSDLEIDLLNDLRGEGQEPSPTPDDNRPKDWKDYEVPERVWQGFPRVCHIDENNQGVYAVLGVVFDHRMGPNGEKAILFGDPDLRKWVRVNDNGYSLKKGMVALINVHNRDGRLELEESEPIMVYHDGALYKWQNKIILSEKFVV